MGAVAAVPDASAAVLTVVSPGTVVDAAGVVESAPALALAPPAPDTRGWCRRAWDWCKDAWKTETASMIAHIPSALFSMGLCIGLGRLIEGFAGDGWFKWTEAALVTVVGELSYFLVFIPIIMWADRKELQHEDGTYSGKKVRRNVLENTVLAGSMITANIPNALYMMIAQATLQYNGWSATDAILFAHISSDAAFTFVVPLLKKGAPAMTNKLFPVKPEAANTVGNADQPADADEVKKS